MRVSVCVCRHTQYASLDVQHSRTSSSASSAGSSYVSSTDSNKDSPTRKVSPAHSRQSSHSSSSQRQCENDRNLLNGTQHATNSYLLDHAPHHQPPPYHQMMSGVGGGGHHQTLPHYQLRLSEQLRSDFCSGDEHNDDDECDDDTMSMKSMSPSAFSRNGGGITVDQFDHPSSMVGGGCHFRHQPAYTTDGHLQYGTIRPHNNLQPKPSIANGNSFAHYKRDAMPELANDGKELNYRTLNGDVIRSVQPPGKGKALPYKVGAQICSCCFVIVLC